MTAEGFHHYTPEVAFEINERNPDRKSVDFFIKLKDALIKAVGVPNIDEVNESLSKTALHLGDIQTVDKFLGERSEENGLYDWWFRDELPRDIMDEASFRTSRKDERLVERIKSADLVRWRNYLREKLENYKQQTEPSIARLREIEITPDVKDLMRKHAVTNVVELFQPGIKINDLEFITLTLDIVESIEFRNRKIKELIAYRYARSVPASMDEETFIKNVHRIISPTNDEILEHGIYRDTYLVSDKDFQVQFQPNTVAQAMLRLSKHIEQTPKTKERLSIEKDALKNYILFEIIHPFGDGNGRTGRALFVHLQRRFADTSLGTYNPIHIPLARYETGTIKKGAQGSRMPLGSISREVNLLLKNVIHIESIKDALRELPDYKADQKTEATQNKINSVIDALVNILNSPEVDKPLEDLLAAIRTEEAQDDIMSQDWNQIYESLKHELKN